jgi:hypothetical protein
MPVSRLRARNEAGAVAVIVAIGATMLFVVAALVVDLGNGFVRDRDVQAQADFAAFAGGAELPGTKSASDPAVQAVTAYLNANQPQDEAAGDCVATESCVTAAQLVDGDDEDGEVYFENNGERLRVVSPNALVEFGFANAVGVSDVEVQAEATVEIRSPGAVLPFFLPRNCVTGPVNLKDNTSGPGSGNVTFDPASGHGGSIPVIDSASPSTVPFGAASTITLEGSDFQTGMEVDFFEESSNDRVPADVTKTLPVSSVTLSSDHKVKSRATVEVPAAVYNRPGTWQVRLSNSFGWSAKFGRINVDSPPVVGSGCGVAATGDYGNLDSPRKNVNQQADASSLNIAEGIDHVLNLFPSPRPLEEKDSCHGLGGTLPAGAVLDDDAFKDTANCVLVQTGMNVPVVTKGLITGGTASTGAFDGLLDTDTLDDCDRNGGDAEKSRIGVMTNDDVLSCFLADGITVGDVTGASIPASAQHSVSGRIFQSPRFAVVPIIDFPVNPQNGYYPILTFQPVFITDETGPSKRGSSYASSNNGVVLDSSGNTVRAITVIPIHPDALPETADQPQGGNTIPWIGSGTKIVVLVD